MTEPKVEESGNGFSAVLNRKIGPFPTWMILVAVGLAIFLFIYLRRQNSSSTDSTDTGTESSATVPPFINQVYTNVIPPERSSTQEKSKTHIIQLKTAGTLSAIAKRWHITKNELIKLNPSLANKYENTGKRVPKGTKIRVPNKDSDGDRDGD